MTRFRMRSSGIPGKELDNRAPAPQLYKPGQYLEWDKAVTLRQDLEGDNSVITWAGLKMG